MRIRIFLSGVLTALCSVLAAAGVLAVGRLAALPEAAAVPELPSGAAVALAEPDAGLPLPAAPPECGGAWSCWETVRTDRAVQCACGGGGAP